MKPTYTYRLVECMNHRGLQIGSRGFHPNPRDDWHTNHVCVEYENTLFTLDLRYVINLVSRGKEPLLENFCLLYELFGLEEQPIPEKEYRQAILIPVYLAVMDYLKD